LYRTAEPPFASGHGLWHAAQASWTWFWSSGKRESRAWSKRSSLQPSDEVWHSSHERDANWPT
jgi:hypothetical protein